MKQISKRLTYANVMSSLAVFLILGGATAYAAVSKVGANEIKANSIKTGKIVKEAVTAGKLKKGAVTESRIADGAVTTNKIANDAVTGDKVKESSLGQVPNAKTLDGIGTSAFSREASSSTTSNALVGVSGTARQVNITAPQNGFLLAVASADVFGSAANSYECEFNIDGANQPQSQRESHLGTENLEENCGTNAIFPVSAGTHNVKFNFLNIAATTTVDETELDVVFIPFAG